MRENFENILKSVGRSENTIKNYIYDIKYIENTIGKDIDKMTKEDLMLFLSKSDNKPASNFRRMMAVKTYCRIYGLPDITKEVKIKVIREKIIIPNDDIMQILDEQYNNEKNLQYKGCYVLLRHTGARVREVLNLTFKDIADDKIIFRQKGGTYRTTPITPAVREIISKLNEKNKKQLFSITYMQFYRDFQDKLQQVSAIIGEPVDIKIHSIRHYVATKLLEQGATIVEVQEILGHKSIQTTQIYTHADPERKKKLLEKL